MYYCHVELLYAHTHTHTHTHTHNLQVPPLGSELEVLYDFEAQDKAELSVRAGQVVTLLCAHDRIGCQEWWLVQTSDSKKGYVPATYLAKDNPQNR